MSALWLEHLVVTIVKIWQAAIAAHVQMAFNYFEIDSVEVNNLN